MEPIVSKEEIGRRLRSERERLKLLQHELAHRAGVTVMSQRNYEAGRRYPDAGYLAHVAVRTDVDVLYVLTGTRSIGERVPEEEAELIFHYRVASDELRAAALRLLGVSSLLRGEEKAAPSTQVGQMVTGGSVNVHGAQHFNVGAAPKKGGKPR